MLRYLPTNVSRVSMARNPPHGEIRWFEIEPCYVYHSLPRRVPLDFHGNWLPDES